MKTHPFVKNILEGGKLVRYGAKTLPAGGWYSMPRNYVDGALIIGDSGSFLDSQRLKGIHMAMKSGMLAAETIFEVPENRRRHRKNTQRLPAKSRAKLHQKRTPRAFAIFISPSNTASTAGSSSALFNKSPAAAA